MQSVTVSRILESEPDRVRQVMADLERFMRSGGFSEATVEGDSIYLRQNLGLGRIELHLDIVEDPEAELAYEQREGLFNEMQTRYAVEPTADGSRVTATTDFELGGVVGSVLDATVVKRKRRQELNAQFDYLESAVAGG